MDKIKFSEQLSFYPSPNSFFEDENSENYCPIFSKEHQNPSFGELFLSSQKDTFSNEIQNSTSNGGKNQIEFKICKNAEFGIINSSSNNSLSPSDGSILIVNKTKNKEELESLEEDSKNESDSSKYKVNYKTESKIQYRYKCEHPGCKKSFKTKKLKISRHNFLNKNCKEDTIILLKTINETKCLLIKSLKKNKNETKCLINFLKSKLINIQQKDYANNILKLNLP